MRDTRPLLFRWLAICLLTTVAFTVGCGAGSNEVTFPDEPVEMPAEDDELVDGDSGEEDSTG